MHDERVLHGVLIDRLDESALTEGQPNLVLTWRPRPRKCAAGTPKLMTSRPSCWPSTQR